MDDAATPNAAPRRSRVSLLVLLIVFAFAIGIALMWSAVRDGKGWWRDGAAPAAQPSPAAETAPAAGSPPATLPNAATTTLAARESALAAQLAALEARTAAISVDVAGAADRAGQAEAILVAFAARRAIERGTPLGYLEEQLRTRFGATQQRAVVTVIQAGRDPVTIEALRQALDSNASILLNPGPGDWFDGLLRELRTLIVLHEANTPSPLPSDRLARARRMLDAGQVEPALEEIGRLPGADRATNWTAAAQRYVEARRALDTLETAAIVGTIPSAARPALPASAPPPVDPAALPLEQPVG
ncbi:hypothetical protein F1C10_13605 [Sphingomonas sp. NBWT7]|uniref:hypothetical protein n=1 Tax=Sphingomonas sp. NBWT7 TaxID=2596913 RepID=UPI00162A36F3|nr:hypothetical protein [Sphingomonas sp. NBWT7]QNE32861.1 hypothetical protein F1C10_13605 [Sphingomonas sp. NBWT7]